MSNLGNSPDFSRPPRVLIANDQEWAARSLETILAAEGCEILRAYTGQQALDRALELQPDLIILDTQLPDILGPDVCRRLRADDRIGWVTPIILTTAGSNVRARQAEAFAAGAWDFATQPFDAELFVLKAHSFLRAKAALDARHPQPAKSVA